MVGIQKHLHTEWNLALRTESLRSAASSGLSVSLPAHRSLKVRAGRVSDRNLTCFGCPASSASLVTNRLLFMLIL